MPLRERARLSDRRILNSQEEIKEIYKTGSGSIRLRGTWDLGPETRSTKTIYIDSVPYTVNKAQLVERIANVVIARKLPHLLDVKDLSTEDAHRGRDEERRRREDDHGVLSSSAPRCGSTSPST